MTKIEIIAEIKSVCESNGGRYSKSWDYLKKAELEALLNEVKYYASLKAEKAETVETEVENDTEYVTETNATHKGWTSEGLDCIYTSKDKAMKALIHAFGGECGDCGFKSNAEILRVYPLTYNVWKKPLYKDKDNFKCYNEAA